MKLPKPRKRGASYRIEIMLNGKRLSATRDTAKECERWAAEKLLEYKVQNNGNEVKSSPTFAEMMALYQSKVGSKKASYRSTKYYERAFIRDFAWLANEQIHLITPKHLTQWRNERLKCVQAGTVRREISFLSAIFSYAIKELFIIESNPFSMTQKPSMPKPRSRRISDKEVHIIKSSGNWRNTITQSQQWTVWAFLFAIETAMRKGEILNIHKSDIKDNYIHLPKTKNGDSRNVPLSKNAKHLLDMALSNSDGNKLVPLTDVAFKTAWQRVERKANISDLNFHDTRHEAISRFVAKGIPVEKLMKITGHKDAKTLINTYYNPSIDELIMLVD